jgi:hypothetical protein
VPENNQAALARDGGESVLAQGVPFSLAEVRGGQRQDALLLFRQVDREHVPGRLDAGGYLLAGLRVGRSARG